LLHWKNIKKIRLRLRLITFGILKIFKKFVHRNASAWHRVIINIIIILIEHVKCWFLGLLWLSQKYPFSSATLIIVLDRWKIRFTNEIQKVELLVQLCHFFRLANHFVEDHIFIKFIQHVAIKVNFFFMVSFHNFLLFYSLLLNHSLNSFLLWSLITRSHNNF